MNPDPATVALSDQDAVELYELLEFVADFIDSDSRLAAMLQRFTGGEGYPVEVLRADLARFIFLLGGPADRLIAGRPQ